MAMKKGTKVLGSDSDKRGFTIPRFGPTGPATTDPKKVGKKSMGTGKPPYKRA